jgi:hypothetical protein
LTISKNGSNLDDMSAVLDYVREKDPRFKEVDDTELTLYIGERKPEFLKDETFKYEHQQAALSRVPIPQQFKTPRPRGSLEPVMAGENVLAGPAAPAQPAPEAKEVDFLKRINADDKGWSPDLRAALKAIQFEPPPGIGKPEFTSADIATIFEQYQFEAANRLETEAAPLRTPAVRISPQWTPEELEALKKAPKSVRRIAGYMDTVGAFGDFLTTFEGVVTLPILAAAGVPGALARLGFGAHMVKGSFDAAEELGKELAKPEADRDLQKIGQLEAAMVLNTALGGTFIGKELGRGAGRGLAAGAERAPGLEGLSQRASQKVVPAFQQWIEATRLSREPGRPMSVEQEAVLGGAPIRQFAPETAKALTEVGEAQLVHPPKPPVEPKAAIPNVPRGTFRPELPETLPEAERGISVVEEIRGNNARTIADIQRLYPQAQLSREAARRLRDQAWPDDAAQRQIEEGSLQQALRNERAALERIENKTQADLDRMAQIDLQVEQAKRGQHALQQKTEPVLPNVPAQPVEGAPKMPPEGGRGPTGERGGEAPPAPAVAPTGPKPPAPPAAAAAEKPLRPLTEAESANLQVTVQGEVKLPDGKTVPGTAYTQIDLIENGQNVWSKSKTTFAKEGIDVPDFSKLPQGRYTYAEAVQKLNQIERAERFEKIQLTKEETLPTGAAAVKSIMDRFDLTDLEARNLLHRERERHAVDTSKELVPTQEPLLPEQPAKAPPEVVKRKRALAADAHRPWDLIDEIEAQVGMRIISLKLVRKNRPNFVPIGAARKLFANEGIGPDVAMQGVEAKKPFGSVDEFLDAINTAGKGRIANRRKYYAEQRALKAEAAMEGSFGKAIRKEGPTKTKVTIDAFYPGAQFTVDGAPVKVKHFLFDEFGEVTGAILDGGSKFGERRINVDQPLNIDKGSLVNPEPATEFGPAETAVPAPAPTPAKLPEKAPADLAELRAAWNKFDETGEITISELADNVEFLISEGKAPESLRTELEAYREAVREDFELAGRGDVDPAAEALAKAIRDALAPEAATSPAPAPTPPPPAPPVEPAKPKRRPMTPAEVESENKRLMQEGSKGVNRIDEEFAQQYTPQRVRDFLMDEINDMLENPTWKKEAAAAVGVPADTADLAKRVLSLFASPKPEGLGKKFIEKVTEGMPDLPELIDTAFRDRSRKDRAMKFALRKLKELLNRNEPDIVDGLEPDNWRDFRVEVWEQDPALAMWIERNLKNRRNFAIEPVYTDATELVIPPRPPGPPKLRAGEKVGEMFQGEDQPFNLAGEKGKDTARIAQEKAEAEKRAREVAELEKKRQQDLFGGQGSISVPGDPLKPAPSPVPTLTPKGQDQIIRDIAKALNIPVRFGRLRSNRFAGYFLPRARLIGSKRANDLPVVTHEAGHALDQTFGLSQNPAIRAELEKLGDPRQVPGSRSSWRPWRNLQYKLGEGIAEFVRYWLTDPPKGRTLAPNTERYFESILDANKDLGDAFRMARDDIQTWRNAPAEARLESHISIGSNPNKTPYTFDQLMRDLVNDLHFLEIASGEARQQSPTGLPPTRDPNIIARNLRGAYGMAGAFLDRGVVDFKTRSVQMGTSLMDALRPVSGRMREFRRYIVARRARELHAQGRETGLVNSDVNATLARYANDAPFNQAFNDLQRVFNGLLNYMADSGLITRDQVVHIRRMGQDYVPLHRVFEVGAGEAPAVEGGGSGRGLNVGTPASLRRLRGSPRPIVDPIETIVRNIYTLVTAAEKAAINNAVADFASIPGMGKWVEHIATPKENIRVGLEKVREQLEDAGADLTDVPEDLLLNFYRNSGRAPFGENTIRVVRPNGDAQFYRLNRDLFETFHALNYEDSGTILRMLSAPAQVLRAGVVLEPSFSLANALRDTFTAAVLNRYGAMPFETTARGVFAMLRNPKLVAEWEASGGKSAIEASYFDRSKLQTFLRERITKDLTLAEQAMVYAKSPLTALRWLAGAFEEATRIGEYQIAFDRLRKAGMPEGDARRQAAYEARDRQDFAKGGAITKPVRHMAAFWNAALQANVTLARAFRDRPARTILQGLAYVTLAKLAEQAINWDDEDYWDRPQWERDLFFLLPVGKDKQGHTRFARIPTPFEVGLIFGTFPGRLIQWYRQNYKQEALTTYPKELLKQTVPNPLPQFLRPIFAGFGEKGWDIWRGRTIIPDSMTDMPPELQWTEQNSLTARNLGKVLKISPMKIDYVIRESTGGLGRQLTHQIIDRAIELVSEQKRTARGTVPGGRFVTTPANVSSQAIEGFYSTLADLRKETEREKAGGTPKLPIEWLPVFEDIQKQMAELRKVTKEAGMTEEDKDAARELILQLARQTMTDFAADRSVNSP